MLPKKKQHSDLVSTLMAAYTAGKAAELVDLQKKAEQAKESARRESEQRQDRDRLELHREDERLRKDLKQSERREEERHQELLLLEEKRLHLEEERLSRDPVESTDARPRLNFMRRKE